MPIILPPAVSSIGDVSADEALPGSGSSIPVGIEAILEYNGLYMNTKTVDRIYISEIDGIDDADVRDNREVNPGDHGETPFDSFYSGRAITLNGRIEAYSLEKLRDLELALRTAFVDLVEKPLIFRNIDSNRDHQIFCRKVGKIAKKESQDGFRFFRDIMIPLRASDPRITTLLEKLSQFNFYSNETFGPETNIAPPRYYFDIGSGTLRQQNDLLVATSTSEKRIYRNNLGWQPTNIRATAKINIGADAAPASSPVFGHIFRKNNSTGEFLSSYLIVNGATSYISILKYEGGAFTQLAGARSANFTIAPSTSYYLRGTADGNTVSVSIWSGDPNSGGVQVVSPMTITLSGSDATKFGAQAGDIGLRIINMLPDYSLDDHKIEELSALSAPIFTSLRNEGNFESRPRVRFYGPMTDAVFTNATNGDYLKVNGTIPANKFYEVDIAQKTFVDELGISKFDQLDILSSWMRVDSGPNDFTFSATNMSGSTPSVMIFWRDTYL
jgi:hypothetical protein